MDVIANPHPNPDAWIADLSNRASWLEIKLTINISCGLIIR